MAQGSNGTLRLIKLTYDEKTPSFWYIRYSGSTERFNEMGKMIKMLGRDGAIYGRTYRWDASYDWKDGGKTKPGGWWMHRSILVSILNGFDNAKVMTEHFHLMEEDAAIYFDKRREEEIEAKRKAKVEADRLAAEAERLRREADANRQERASTFADALKEMLRKHREEEEAERLRARWTFEEEFDDYIGPDAFEEILRRFRSSHPEGWGNTSDGATWSTASTHAPVRVPVTVHEALTVLQLSATCTQDQASANYKRLVKQYHVDLVGGTDDMIKKVNIARDIVWQWKRWPKSKQ